MDAAKLAELVDRLTAKTESGDLVWREGLQENAYEVHFPRQSVIIQGPIGEIASMVKPDEAMLKIFNNEGELALNVTGSLVPLSPTQIDVRRLSRLIRAAYNSVHVGREKVLDELLEQLG